MRTLFVFAALAAISLLAACDGRGTPPVSAGSISGTLEVSGPFNGAAELNVGAFAPGSDTPVQSAVAGRVTSVATATLNGRSITFSFTELSLGSYEIGVYSDGPGGKTFYYRSAPLTISAEDPTVTGHEATISFSGAGPFGSVSGVVLLEEGFTFPQDRVIFVGISPLNNPPAALQQLVSSADVNSSGQLFYNLESIAYGQWLVGLYSYNPATHEVQPLGLLDAPVSVSATTPNITGAVFPAANAGDPGADPELGTISGTVNFNGALPAGQSIHIAANTIPPQQGAPPATIEVQPEDIGSGRTLDFLLPGLPEGEYSVAIFSYDFANHQAIYFGTYDGSVTLNSSEPNVGDVDFPADVTVIGGQAD